MQDSGHPGTVDWIGVVRDRDGSLRSASLKETNLEFSGLPGESHGGLTRPSCVRVEELYPLGTDIRNTRQLSIASAEDLAAIAREMGLSDLAPALIGANVVIRGIPDFTLVPPGSRIQFAGGATVTVDLENHPCNLPAREIEMTHPGFGRKFKTAARGRRGITGWVEREGVIRPGDSVRLFIPTQPAWPHAG